MKKHLLYLIYILGISLGMSQHCLAQFNPTNPEEPNMSYKLTVKSDPENVAYCSGEGSYMAGTGVLINTSGWNDNYVFSHWTLNGKVYTRLQNFTYSTPAGVSEFVAHYTFNPVSPSEPETVLRRKLLLDSSPKGVASFCRTSGEYQVIDSYVWLEVYPNQGYVFTGWYEGDNLVSQDNAFNYLMPDRTVTLTAHFKYSPDSPVDPSGSGEKTLLIGDVNQDGVVDEKDAAEVMAEYKENTTDAASLKLYDINEDGIIDVSDVVLIINIMNGK